MTGLTVLAGSESDATPSRDSRELHDVERTRLIPQRSLRNRTTRARFERQPICQVILRELADVLEQDEQVAPGAVVVVRETIIDVQNIGCHIGQSALPHTARAKFTESGLKRSGVAPSELATLVALSEQLPNLQLLDKADNGAGGKGTAWPKDWLDGLSQPTRSRYSRQDVTAIAGDLGGFRKFHEARRKTLRVRIHDLLEP